MLNSEFVCSIRIHITMFLVYFICGLNWLDLISARMDNNFTCMSTQHARSHLCLPLYEHKRWALVLVACSCSCSCPAPSGVHIAVTVICDVKVASYKRTSTNGYWSSCYYCWFDHLCIVGFSFLCVFFSLMALTSAMIMLSYGRKASSKTKTSAEGLQVKSSSVQKWLSHRNYGGNWPIKVQFKKWSMMVWINMKIYQFFCPVFVLLHFNSNSFDINGKLEVFSCIYF